MDLVQTATEQKQGEAIMELSIAEIQPNPFQPRLYLARG